MTEKCSRIVSGEASLVRPQCLRMPALAITMSIVLMEWLCWSDVIISLAEVWEAASYAVITILLLGPVGRVRMSFADGEPEPSRIAAMAVVLGREAKVASKALPIPVLAPVMRTVVCSAMLELLTTFTICIAFRIGEEKN